MAVGKVKWFDDAKGFGFIERVEISERSGAASKDEVFVHFSAIVGDKATARKSLQPGDDVEFDLYESPKGYQAFNVSKRSH